MVQLEELDADAPPPDLEEIPGAELSARILACDGLWLASELALEEAGLLTDKGVTHICVFGAIPNVPGAEAFAKRRHVYVRAENGALVTHLRKYCDFVGEAIAGGGQVAVVSEEEGEAGAAFLIGAYLIVEKGMRAEDAADAVVASRPVSGIKEHREFMKNLRFLERNGIPDWA